MFVDHRGSLESIDCSFHAAQILVSRNYKGTLKGLHKSPYRKKVHVSKGTIYDFFSDGTNTTEIVLHEGDSIEIPAHNWHGYKCIEDSEVLYLLEGVYDPKYDEKAFWKSPEFTFTFNFDEKHIISESDLNARWAKKYKYFIVGNGFLGNQFKKFHPDSWISSKRLDDPELIQDIEKSGCEAVICAAGIRGKPNIDWCETHEYETFKTNFLDTVKFFEQCKTPIIYFGSGMVYSKPGKYTESDPYEHDGKVYSKWRIRLEEVIPWYEHVTYLRIMYPMSLDGHPQCFREKMKERSPHSIEVPVTIIPILFPQIPVLIGKHGIFNFVCEEPIYLPTLSDKEPICGESRGAYTLDVKRIKDIGIVTGNV
jgi:dTDP-4-dehydrorhamnose 3,5-epimerase-like enzyme